MWQFATPSRKRIKAGQTTGRRTRLYRPHCKPLEDRCLLSVSLSGSEPPVPLVGSPVTWTATASGHGDDTRLPVPRRTDRWSVPRGS